ncbi:MAG: DUF362 domain-containing protein [archaeon]
MTATVALVRGDRSVQTVQKALNLIGGVEHLSGRPVLIKVNFIGTKKWDSGATTDPIVTEALIQMIQQSNRDVYVVESDSTFTNATKAAEATGTRELCVKYGVPFLNLSDLSEKVTVRLDGAETLKDITIPKLVTTSLVVSAAKMKTHESTGVTLGLKNMFGLLPDKFKMKYHARNISKVVVDINRVVAPSLTVIDGFVGMEGSGPVHGIPIKMDLIIAGRDVVATDAVAARAMGFDPHEIYHIRRAAELKIGLMDDVKIVGESLESVSREFRRG